MVRRANGDAKTPFPLHPSPLIGESRDRAHAPSGDKLSVPRFRKMAAEELASRIRIRRTICSAFVSF